MMLIISIIIAIWLAKALVEIFIGLAEIIYGLTLILTATVLKIGKKLSRVIEGLWKLATDQ